MVYDDFYEAAIKEDSNGNLFFNFPDDLNEIVPNEDSSAIPSSVTPEVASQVPPFGGSNQKLLPEVLPTTDPGQSAMPIFLKEPLDTFLIRAKPATLHCRVAHALRVYFQCNSEAVEPTAREDHVEPETGVRYTEASVDIHRDKVEEYFSEFHCACVAISGKGSVVSRHALVTSACKYNMLSANAKRRQHIGISITMASTIK